MRDPRMLDLNYDAKPRIGMYRSLQWRHAQAETKEAYAQAAAILARAGAQVEVPQPPAGDCMLVQLHADIMAYEASQSLAYERLEHAAQLSAKIQSVLEAGARITAEEHQRNLARAAGCARGGPVVRPLRRAAHAQRQREAPFADLGTGDPQFSRGWTLFGLPCLNLPFATGPQGLPVGLRWSARVTRTIARWPSPPGCTNGCWPRRRRTSAHRTSGRAVEFAARCKSPAGALHLGIVQANEAPRAHCALAASRRQALVILGGPTMPATACLAAAGCSLPRARRWCARRAVGGACAPPRTFHAWARITRPRRFLVRWRRRRR